MKKLSILTLLLLTLFSCKEEKIVGYTIAGNDAKEGMVYIWSSDDTRRELSSVMSNGSFSIFITLNDATPLTLVLPDSKSIPLYAEPGIKATLQPDTLLKSGWYVKGGRTQALHDSISRVLDAAEEKDKQKKIIEEFITKYPISEVNVELFRRYLVDIPDPDNEYIRKTISKLGGALQDHNYFANIKEIVDKKSGNVKHRMFPNFHYLTTDSVKCSLGIFTDKYVLINFWATWNTKSHEQMKELRNLRKIVRSENFAILNISLDTDSTKWLGAVNGDSIIGHHVLERHGMNSEIMETFNITSLPYSVLVTPYKRIAEYDLPLDSMAGVLIDSLTYKHDTRNQKKKKNNR